MEHYSTILSIVNKCEQKFTGPCIINDLIPEFTHITNAENAAAGTELSIPRQPHNPYNGNLTTQNFLYTTDNIFLLPRSGHHEYLSQ